MSQNPVSRQKLTTTSIHITALDGTVNVNSLFTFASFLGLAVNLLDLSSTLIESPACTATLTVARHFVEFHVYSFSSFLFSSLIALGLKQAIRTKDPGGEQSYGMIRCFEGHVNLQVLRAGILASAAGSLSGCIFLTLALVDLVQIKLGDLACADYYSLAAIGPLVTLVPSALVIYILLMIYAFTR